MQRAFVVISLLIPLIGVSIYYFRPQLKDQALDTIFYLVDVLNDSLQQNGKYFVVMFIIIAVNWWLLFSSDQPSSDGKCLEAGELLFTPSSLAHYDGSAAGNEKIYLAFLGIVYDVTKGARHYSPGNAYSFFAGKDASKAFITGQFNPEGLIDDVTDLPLDSYTDIKMWQEFYGTEYSKIGKIVGTYYDNDGCPTDAVSHVSKMLEEYEASEVEKSKENELFPLCNSEFHKETNYHRVWCTSMSGGVNRSWIGVPRQLYLPKEKTYRCACVRDSGPATAPTIEYVDENEPLSENVESNKNSDQIGDLGNPRIKEYPGCNPKATECVLGTK